jgi:DNA-binding MarR family transcriptional regulator
MRTDCITLTPAGRALLEQAEDERLFNIINHDSDDTVSTASLVSLLDANEQDEALCIDLLACKLNESVHVGGGAAPHVELVRIK